MIRHEPLTALSNLCDIPSLLWMPTVIYLQWLIESEHSRISTSMATVLMQNILQNRAFFDAGLQGIIVKPCNNFFTLVAHSNAFIAVKMAV